MITPPLMSERDDPYAPGGRWFDCTYAAAIMVVYKSGYRTFPLGYGWQEREALERSDNRPNETGATPADVDVATQNRYHITLAKVPDMDTLASYLKGPANRGLMLGGFYPSLPSWQKRWDPAFAGNHSTYVQPMGDGMHVRWLDPLATWGFGGDVIDWQVAYNFVNASNGKAANCRMAVEPAAPQPAPAPGVTLKYGGYAGFRGTWKVTQNYSRLRRSPYIKSDNIIQQVNAGFIFTNAQTTDQGTYVNGSPRWLGSADGNTWIHVSLVELVK